jgi:trigger factor
VTDEDVAKMVDALRDEHADTLTVEDRGLKMGDYVHMDYTGIADGKPIVELVPDHTELGEYKGFWLLVESDAFLPGFCEQLLDARVGEKRQVLINFAADFGKKELAGRKATYFVDVTGIKEKKLPELNDEFAEKVGAKSLDELKKTVRKNMITQREKAVQNDVHNQIMDQLLKQTQFDLPESLVAAETRGIAHDLVREYTMHGVSREELEQRKSEIFSMATRNAKDRLRAAFILDAIAEKEKIEVEESEVNARIVQLAQHNRTTPERLKVQLMERGTLSQIENQIREGKTLDFLVTSAKVEVAK